ncbi:MAG TPA: hypothetical protein G4N99_02020 [Thermoflexia bacterium]|nr:hypothetical protein [Thermoflexia bacterium]
MSNRVSGHAIGKSRLLMQMLAALEYRNDENWCDVHPVLIPLLEEQAADDPNAQTK